MLVIARFEKCCTVEVDLSEKEGDKMINAVE